MKLFTTNDQQFQQFISDTEGIIDRLSPLADEKDIATLKQFIGNFKIKTDDFYRENRKLNIGVIGQVKAGKSSFLNTLLFEGKEILPKAATPKTATLTKMEYSEHNRIHIEYYAPEEWELLEDNAAVDLEDEIFTSAKELLNMVRRNGLDPIPYLKKGYDEIEFDSYQDLIANLNHYVGEDGKFTPIVKAVTLYVNREEFRGLSIVDTPGLNDPIVSRTMRTKEFMEVCDVVFFLSQSGSFLDKSDWSLLSSQLPQKGVKRLVLIASKYDSGIRDILRVKDDEDPFDDDDNAADNIPAACKIIRKKLKKRAKAKVEEFVNDLTERESSPELIAIIRQCADPILVSSMVCNMAKKPESEYTPEEQNIYAALKRFSDNIVDDLHLLGNFDEVNAVFEEVIAEKGAIFEQKAKGFIPTAQTELCMTLKEFQERTDSRISVLEKTDKDQLLAQKNAVESQINHILSDVAAVFSDLYAKLETEKAEGIREIREDIKDHLHIKERTGSETKTGSYTKGHLFWKKIHYYTYEEHYSYTLAADAAENLLSFAADAGNHIEQVFSDSLDLKSLKRRLLNVVVQNFDMGSEKYDSTLFRILVSETIGKIDFPVFHIKISDSMESITAKFTGELTSSKQQNELASALYNAISNTSDELVKKLSAGAADFKKEMEAVSGDFSDNLLKNIRNEFETLLSQYKQKEKEIDAYRSYSAILKQETEHVKEAALW